MTRPNPKKDRTARRPRPEEQHTAPRSYASRKQLNRSKYDPNGRCYTKEHPKSDSIIVPPQRTDD